MAPELTSQFIEFKEVLELSKLHDVHHHPAPIFKYYGFKPGTVTLEKGHQRFEGVRPLPCDLVWERDTAVNMRDGVKIYTDVFRLPEAGKVPTIIHWGPYGKTGAGLLAYDMMGPFECGIPKHTLSGYHKFEALDPAEWCPRGYAIANVDQRGAFDSEGDLPMNGIQDAQDIYDFIEWVIAQPWSNGCVTMAGNSMLAMAQVNHASRCPHPALKCIAPWEAVTDQYRDVTSRGGTTWLRGFNGMIVNSWAGAGSYEDMNKMGDKFPEMNEYWESKVMPIDNINIPMYNLASYSSMIHTHGSFATFRQARTQDKWLRVHNTHEWYDLYRPHNQDELQKFFDRYTKGIDNGWERDTPRVRLSLLNYNGASPMIEERVEAEYPLSRTQYRKCFLDVGTLNLSDTIPGSEKNGSYDSESLTDTLDFRLVFDRYTELAGYSKVKLWMSCKESNDMEVVVQLRKLDVNGKPLSQHVFPVPVPLDELPKINTVLNLGPQGALRASHACTYNAEKSTEVEPYYMHDRRQLIEPGKIVSLDIGIWPWGATFNAGESLMLRVAGHNMCHPETERIRPKVNDMGNKGKHTVHTGGQYDSHIIIPVIN